MEYLPILKEKNGKIIVAGQIERLKAHRKPPVCHATAIIAAILPDGRILLADKTEKQRKKGKAIPDYVHIYDCFGGHMRYDSIPEQEHREGLSVETFRECAYRELSEELLRVDIDGSSRPFVPVRESPTPVGFYSMENDHNREYSWAFLYVLPDFGPYTSEDTLTKPDGEESISQPVRAVSLDELLKLYQKGESCREMISDGIGRVLKRDNGKELRQCIEVALNAR